MAFDDLYRTHKGPLSIGETNELVRTLEDLDVRTATIEGNLNDYAITSRKIRIRLTACNSDGAFSWYEVFDQGGDGTSTRPDGAILRGDPDNFPAYRVLGCLGVVPTQTFEVPIDGGAVVTAWPAKYGSAWFFEWEPSEILAQIGEGDDDAYAWTNWVPTGDDGAYGCGTLSGTTDVNPAYELNGLTTVPSGSIVTLRRGFCSGCPTVTTGKTQSGNGSTPVPSPISDIWSIVIENVGNANGTFALVFDNTKNGSNPQTTAPLYLDTSAAGVETALEALSNIPIAINVTGTGVDGDPFLVAVSGMDYTAYDPPATVQPTVSDQEWGFIFGGAGAAVQQPFFGIVNGTYDGGSGGFYWVTPADYDPSNTTWFYTTLGNGTTSVIIPEENFRPDVPLGLVTLCSPSNLAFPGNFTFPFPETAAGLTLSGYVNQVSQTLGNGTKAVQVLGLPSLENMTSNMSTFVGPDSISDGNDGANVGITAIQGTNLTTGCGTCGFYGVINARYWSSISGASGDILDHDFGAAFIISPVMNGFVPDYTGGTIPFNTALGVALEGDTAPRLGGSGDLDLLCSNGTRLIVGILGGIVRTAQLFSPNTDVYQGKLFIPGAGNLTYLNGVLQTVGP